MDANTITSAVADKLIQALSEKFPESSDCISAIKPLLRPMIALGVAEGVDAVDRVVEGLIAEDSYPAWRSIYEAATPEERIALNDQARQRLMQDALVVLERRQQLWSTLKIAAGILGSALVAVL